MTKKPAYRESSLFVPLFTNYYKADHVKERDRVETKNAHKIFYPGNPNEGRYFVNLSMDLRVM